MFHRWAGSPSSRLGIDVAVKTMATVLPPLATSRPSPVLVNQPPPQIHATTGGRQRANSPGGTGASAGLRAELRLSRTAECEVATGRPANPAQKAVQLAQSAERQGGGGNHDNIGSLPSPARASLAARPHPKWLLKCDAGGHGRVLDNSDKGAAMHAHLHAASR